MRHKMALQDIFYRSLYLFRPFMVIGTCLLLMTAADFIGFLLLLRVQSTEAHDVILAIITGITASVIVAIIIEMANNYQRNNKRWLLLSRLFSTLLHYSSDLAVFTGHFDSNKHHVDLMTKIHKNLVAQGKESEEEAQAAIEKAAMTFREDENDEDSKLSHDRVRCVFSCLPDIVPHIYEAYYNYDGVFHLKELTSMETILRNYDHIKLIVQEEIMDRSTIIYGLDPKNPGKLVTWLPERVKSDLDRMTLLILARLEREEERKKIAEALVREGTSGLSSLGIELGEELMEDESDDEGQEGTREDLAGRIISGLVIEIDHELLNLQEIIKSEPGFGSFYSFMEKAEEKYLR